MVGHQSTVYIWDAKKATLQWERSFSYSFGSDYNRDLFVTTCSRDASFFISISDCHCIYSFGRTGDQTEQDEGSFGNQRCIQSLGKSINRCKRKLKKKRKKIIEMKATYNMNMKREQFGNGNTAHLELMQTLSRPGMIHAVPTGCTICISIYVSIQFCNQAI